METPLLASNDEDERPSLSSLWSVDDESNSQFARLLEQRAPSLNAANNWRVSPTTPTTSPNNQHRLGTPVSNNPANSDGEIKEWKVGPWMIVWMLTADILYLGLIWGSYMSSEWSTTSIAISTPFTSASLPLQSTALVDLLTEFRAVVFVWISSLLIPFVFMVVSPSWILKDTQYKRTLRWRGSYGNSIRTLVECSVRWALFTFYVLILLQLAVDSVSLHWTGTGVFVRSQAQCGLASYVIGVACALAVVVLLRWPPPLTITSDDEASTGRPDYPEEPTMMALEDVPANPRTALNPFDEPISSSATEGTTPLTSNTRRRGRPRRICDPLFWYRVAAYQLGVLSVVLLIPSYTLPILHLYSPAYDSHQTVTLSSVPGLLGQLSSYAETPVWIVGALGVVFMISVYVSPVMAIVLAVASWFLPEKSSRRSKLWLYAIHPTMGQLVWSAAVVFFKFSLLSWSQAVLEEKANVCSLLQSVTEDCWLLQASFQPGVFLLIVQSVASELLVWFTLRAD